MVVRSPLSRIFCFLSPLLLFALVTFIFTSSDKKGRYRSEKPLVLSTIAPLEALVHALAWDCVHSVCLIQGDLDPHTYQLRKGDGDLFSLARLVVYNGLGLEHGASLFQSLDGSPHAFSVGSLLSNLDESFVIRSGGLPDPHIWLDLRLLYQVVPELANRLAEICPEKKGLIFQRSSQLVIRLREADDLVRQMVQEVPSSKRYLVSAHSAFSYFVRSYLASEAERQDGSWIERYISPEGLAPEAQVSFSHFKKVFEFVLQHDVRVVFPEVNVPSLALTKLVSMSMGSGHALRLSQQALYSDSFPRPVEEDHLGKYIEVMVHNARAFRDAILEEE
ncbi:metal ABC transporter solute-binding protein, Zn/Mn family [Candidatus Similichlamydia laticola]|uniref:Manganese ABC transporter, periplasmic-binding protein SitA n=1 Tax=Candidatus Similichlamydia laticola TaxID=2170265 RepID=A0A369KJ95_9BACT|nr:zinc ABC transporter substrate-binding protein [Candidatus Similichlamydia laticola]RDB31853.1 Manganese ABC transporter, periplasmic-binding protein SitA [Candidatus Similichlamydia laticola]